MEALEALEELEYREAKINYEALSMTNTPSDPIEAVSLSIRFEEAKLRYFRAQENLRRYLQDKLSKQDVVKGIL